MIFSKHARERMVERSMSYADVANVLTAGRFAEERTTLENNTWRYVFQTPIMGVVVAFDSTRTKLVIVTVVRF